MTATMTFLQLTIMLRNKALSYWAPAHGACKCARRLEDSLLAISFVLRIVLVLDRTGASERVKDLEAIPTHVIRLIAASRSRA